MGRVRANGAVMLLMMLVLEMPSLSLARGGGWSAACAGRVCADVEGGCTDAQVFDVDVGCCGVCLEVEAQDAFEWAADHPVLEATTCPTRLWQPSEIPQLHELDVTMDPADFRWMIDNQDTQYDDARDMEVTSLTFDGERFTGGHFKTHGGKYQRGGGLWDGEAGRDGSTQHDMEGGNCYRRSDRTAEFKCKPSFRYKFDKKSPYNAVFDTLFRYPADKQRCNDPREFRSTSAA